MLSKIGFRAVKADVCACFSVSSTLSNLLTNNSYFPNKSFADFSACSLVEFSNAVVKSCLTAYKSTFKSFTTLTKSKPKTSCTADFSSANSRLELFTSITDASSL